MPSQTVKTKRCSKCGKILPLTEFYLNASKPSGREYACKKCRKLYMQSARVRCDKFNFGATRRGASGKVSLEDLQHIFFIYGGQCPRCGKHLAFKQNANGLAVCEFDHVVAIEDGGSNHASNIQILCSRCNKQTRHDREHYLPWDEDVVSLTRWANFYRNCCED